MLPKTNKYLETYKLIDNTLNNLPSHKQIHDDLLVLKDLISWLYRSNCMFTEQNQTKTFYDDLKQNYIETVKQLYIREINAFTLCAKARILKNDRPKASKQSK